MYQIHDDEVKLNNIFMAEKAAIGGIAEETTNTGEP